MLRARLVKSATLAAIVAIACAGAVPAGAQGGGLEITAFNGYYIASDLYTSVGSVTGGQIGLNNSYMWGGRLGIDPNPRFGVEFVYTRIGSDLEVKTTVPGYTPGEDLGRINGNCYDLDFLFYQQTPNPRTRAYFTAGLGWTDTDPKVTAASGATIEGNSLFAWNFGLGAKIDVNERAALRLEGRWRVTDTHITTSSGVYCDYWGYCYGYSSDWYNSGELTAGLTIKLGGSR